MFDSLKRWRDAREHLDIAIQSYLECLDALGSDFQAQLRTIDTNSLEKIAVEAQKELGAIDSRGEEIAKGKRVIGKIRNKSSSLVPACNLPSEIFLEIFRLCARDPSYERAYCDSVLCVGRHYALPKLLTLTQVCASWRSIIVSTPSFWEHLDMRSYNVFNSNNVAHCVQLFLERSLDRPLCFDLSFPTKIDWLSGEPITPAPTAPAPTFLLPYMDRLQSLYLGYYTDTAEVIDFLSLWFSMASIPTVYAHTLAIWRDDDFGPEEDEIFVYDPVEHQISHSLLQPIRVLRLNGFVFEWDCPVYHNLIHLHLDDLPDEASPSIDEIRDILAACPELRILQLTRLYLTRGERDHLRPVTLNHLEVLDLNFLYEEGMSLLLPLLVIPQGNPLSFKLSPYPSSHVSGSAALAYLARTNVYRLSISPGGLEDVLEEYLSAAKNLTVLILELMLDDGDAIISAMAQVPPSVCPNLHTLYLFNGAFKEISFRSLIENYPNIKKWRSIESHMFDIKEGCPKVTMLEGLRDLIPDAASMRYEKLDGDTYWYDTVCNKFVQTKPHGRSNRTRT